MANVTFFKAVEIIVRDRKINAKQAESWLKTNLASGALALVSNEGAPLSEDEFATNLAKIE